MDFVENLRQIVNIILTQTDILDSGVDLAGNILFERYRRRAVGEEPHFGILSLDDIARNHQNTRAVIAAESRVDRNA